MNFENIDRSLERIIIEPDGLRRSTLNPQKLNQEAREDLIDLTLKTEGGCQVQWAPEWGISVKYSKDELHLINNANAIERVEFIAGVAMDLKEAIAIDVFSPSKNETPLKNLTN